MSPSPSLPLCNDPFQTTLAYTGISSSAGTVWVQVPTATLCLQQGLNQRVPRANFSPMPKDLSRVQTVVIALMENRSFDHLLGYFGLPDSGHPRAARIDGIQHANLYYAHSPYPPRRITSAAIDPDPDHEREDIAIQINSLAGPMMGFVDSYRQHHPGADVGRVMEYCTNGYLNVTDFLARSGTICDNWFACLPASTLPNRLMASAGYAVVDHTPDGYLSELKDIIDETKQDLLYDWLERHGRSWRVYHSGSPFFMTVPRILAKYESDVQTQNYFRPIESLVDDFTNDNLPDVVFVEPLYQDDPRRGSAQATDDHAPASLYGGQRFLKVVHEALTANPSVWNRLVAVITYDEHGSFFDHVPPPALRTDPSPGSNWKGGRFDTLGMRVPTIVLCPFVQSGSLYEGVLDHTSILKFLGDLYGNGRHSESVDSRRVGNLADVLDDDLLSGAMPLPSLGPIP